MLRQILFDSDFNGSLAANVGFLLLRVFTGLAMAFSHGLGKVPPSDKFIEVVEKLGFPMPAVFAWAAGLSEFAGGILLALGLLTRPASFLILVTMMVAAFGQHFNDPFAKKELALLFAFIVLAFMLAGAGDYSLDKFLKAKK